VSLLATAGLFCDHRHFANTSKDLQEWRVLIKHVVAHTAWILPSKSDGWMMYPADSEMVVHMVSPTKSGPRVTSQKQEAMQLVVIVLCIPIIQDGSEDK